MNQSLTEPVLHKEHPLILSSRVVKTPVFNRVGERIGHVDDLSIGKVDGKVIYAIMSFGGFLGIGEKFHPLPWSLLEYDVERGGFIVPLDRPALENAPQYTLDELRALGGADYREAVFGYYGPFGVAPYW